MDAALALQFGHGLNNLHSLVLAQQKASEEWRLELGRKLDEKFASLERRLDTVCDDGGKEHEAIRARLSVLELDRERELAWKAGREHLTAAIGNGLTWTMKHGLKILFIAYVAWDAVLFPMIENAMAEPAEVLDIRGAL